MLHKPEARRHLSSESPRTDLACQLLGRVIVRLNGIESSCSRLGTHSLPHVLLKRMLQPGWFPIFVGPFFCFELVHRRHLNMGAGLCQLQRCLCIRICVCVCVWTFSFIQLNICV